MYKNSFNVPAFLTKLWDMVNDPNTNHLICWTPSGNSFIILNQAKFWYELLPLYYKHNNMSSFVRQLNMYGFHKVSMVENGTMDSEKDEIQFCHEYFKKDHKELLKNIKRKQVTGSKIIPSNGSGKSMIETHDLSKVLTDFKQLRNRQASVDSQLTAIKHENSVLWRELVLLRQKHKKQQQIVNKLIQFLMTIVQPTARMSGLGVKRHFPLMINEKPKKAKKSASSTSEGPTIHELDNDGIPDSFLSDDLEEATPEVASPACSTKSNNSAASNNLKNEADQFLEDYPDMVTDKEVDSLLDVELPEEEAENEDEAQKFDSPDYVSTDMIYNPKVFMNSWSQDKLLSNLISGSYNASALNGNSKPAKKDAETAPSEATSNPKPTNSDDMAVATRDPNIPFNRSSSVEDLELHLESSQHELDQLKEILNGVSGLDANALLGNAGGSVLKLFNDDTALPYELTFSQDPNNDPSKTDPLVSGSELTPYGSGGLLDFSQLFDDTSNPMESVEPAAVEAAPETGTINTPQIGNEEPTFPLNE